MDIDFSNHQSSHDFALLQSPSNLFSGSSEVERENSRPAGYMAIQDMIFFEPSYSWESILVQQNNIVTDLHPIGRKRSAAAGEEAIQKAGFMINSPPNKRVTRFKQHVSPKLQRQKAPEQIPKSKQVPVIEVAQPCPRLDFDPATLRDNMHPMQIQRQSPKRSKKLMDKVTALQKLVSPYGKTDTASVLLEASITIKALQNQIQDLVHGLPEENVYRSGERHGDLRSRGLCLVPLSFSNVHNI